MKKITKIIVGISILLLLPLTVLTGCGSSGKTIKVGIMGGDKRIWQPIAQELKHKGINLQLVSFSDYSQPNAALQNHEIDLNSFQHEAFLDNWNKAHHSNIVSIGKTFFSPLALYSTKVKNIQDLKKGASIALPNDPTNEGRALYLLKSAGLITLKNTPLPTVKDVTSNKLNLKLNPLNAAQTPRALSDQDGAIVNAGYALDAKLNAKDVIYKEKVNKDSAPYINLIATNKDEKNKKEYQEIVKAYQSAANKKRIAEVYKGQYIPAWDAKW
ncbi:MetQ/NlpA family ABC transporter substrate-binding protein [Apilactobacillus xinyiensis]|uniref:MetQ/NlpA family ABC transporter substrate-binding protein n=1 Tax=Apilactobacillus xinyiensis TaxID=2841032 RepID=UPI00200D4813|nr:MetQ/NlpA family ABC transporter substrate-binding protein [Apilactobacillus xinyiensis]MCL0329735.1 MetQ/NlpA family ABC transporter substrate-binding protein [Apilactobacillus xinyiensis]